MISATSVPSSSPVQPGVVLAADESLEQATAVDATDFVAQLQAVLSGQARMASDDVQDVEDAEALALTAAATDPLQNVPTPPLPQEVVAAIFAAPAASAPADPSLTDADAVAQGLMASPAGPDASSLQVPGLVAQPDADGQPVPQEAVAGEPRVQAEFDRVQAASAQSALKDPDQAQVAQIAAKSIAEPFGAIPLADDLPATATTQINVAPGASPTQPPASGQPVQTVHQVPADPVQNPLPASASVVAKSSVVPVDVSASPSVVADSASPLQPQVVPRSEVTAMQPTVTDVVEDQAGITGSQNVSMDTAGLPSQAQSAIAVLQPATAGGVSFATSSAVPDLDATQRAPLEPHQMRLDSGPVQVEVLKLVRQGGGQILLELTPPDQGTYRLDLRLDAQGRAHLVVEGASDSVRTRLEQGEAGLREQLSQMGLSLDLNYRQSGSQYAADRSDSGNGKASDVGVDGVASQEGTGAQSAERAQQRLERGLVHLYA